MSVDEATVSTAAAVRVTSGSVYRNVASERTTFEFTTAELAGRCPKLMIAKRLAQAGIIDMQTEKRLELAFQEAITNACDHGNLELESTWKEALSEDGVDRYTEIRSERLQSAEFSTRQVRIVTDYSDGTLQIRVRDEGQGFNPDATAVFQSDLVLSSGRGLPLIRQTMDRVWHELSGREIVMVKAISAKQKIKEL